MSIASEITRIQTAKENLKNAIINKGGAIAENANLEDYVTAVNNISGGSETTLVTKNITANGTYTATDDSADGYSSVTVNVASTGGIDVDDIIANNEPSGAIVITGTETAEYSLYNKTAITSVSAPNLTTCKKGVFRGCTGITSVSMPLCTKMENEVFYGCTSLTTIDFPELTSVGQNLFNGCSSVTTVNLPKATSIPTSALANCTSIQFLYLPKMTQTGTSSFNGCTNLTTIIAPVLTSFGANSTFAKCSNLTTIVFGYNGVVNCQNISNFNETPLVEGGAGATVYIPQAIYDHLGDGTALDYKAHARWSVFDGYGTITWAVIEGSEYEQYMPTT